MRTVFAFALMALAGCEVVAPSNNSGPANLAQMNQQTPHAPVAESPLVGRWADVGASCARPVEIFGNGIFRAVDGSRGHWRQEGDRLRINVGERVYNFQLVSVTRDRIDVIDGNGQRGASVRCP